MTTLVREKQDSESSEWTAEEEVQLFLAMDGVKPVGVNRHFYMACITERLGKALQREVASEAIWTHLRSMYNLKALDEQEFVPFLNEECDFDLPEADFSAAIGRRKQEDTERLAVPPAVCEPDAKKSESKSDTAMVKVTGKCPQKFKLMRRCVYICIFHFNSFKTCRTTKGWQGARARGKGG